MNTPICDFVDKYAKRDAMRLHIPGHKGKSLIGPEEKDITEIIGADSLFEANGIIEESEKNASTLFSCPTFYSTEGSSLCIRAMLYLAVLNQNDIQKKSKPVIVAARNAHKSFLSAAALLDFDIIWLCGNGAGSYLSCNTDADEVEKAFASSDVKPAALYLTSPDYLGNMANIKEISEICRRYNVLLIVDNAHGAYLKFLQNSMHPIDLGADMCCSSAHKTLPSLTGGAYMHLSPSLPESLICKAKAALSLFASSSPSYLILQSLDKTNLYLSSGYKEKLISFIPKVKSLKNKLSHIGFKCISNEPLKLTIASKPYGYTGFEFASLLEQKNIVCEFFDSDFVVMMLTPELGDCALDTLFSRISEIKQREPVISSPPPVFLPERALSVREAVFSETEPVNIKACLKRIFADINIACPPAVPVIVAGEVIDENILSLFEYYNIESCRVVKMHQ